MAGFRLSRKEIKGFQTTLTMFKNRQARLDAEMQLKVLVEQAKVVFFRSQELCPMETGLLRASGRVVVTPTVGQVGEVAIVYGGTSTDTESVAVIASTMSWSQRRKHGVANPREARGAFYAVYVHEIEKNYLTPGTQWKYVETAVKEKWSEMNEVAARVAAPYYANATVVSRDYGIGTVDQGDIF